MNVGRIIESLDTISRRRALTLSESLRLEQAIKQQRRWRHRGGWSAEEDAIATARREAGWSYGLISSELPKRSYNAVAARLRYLRLREEATC